MLRQSQRPGNGFDFIRTYQIFILPKIALNYSRDQEVNHAASIVRTLFSSIGQKSRLARRKSYST